ncbi:MAG: IMP dehydrogenase [Desulfurococcales archaeon]|nr:IMP dehydrogenase [Desulfurococcales archaeon]MEB3799203.1 IMP dehydrogenase [Desulfurococcales archaeon]
MEEIIVFDDVVIIPGFSPVEPSKVDLSTNITTTIRLSIPVVSSPMDTVTEYGLAAKLARLGGIGVIHRNMSIEEQLLQVEKVKKTPPEPLANDYMDPNRTVRLERTNGSSRIVIDEPESVHIDDIQEISSYLRTVSAYTLKPSTGQDGRLAVGAAVSPFDYERIEKLDKIADLLVVDVAHAHNRNVISSLASLSKKLRSDLVVGNLGTKQGVLDMLSRIENVKALRIGVSSGSICITGEVTGAAAPTLWAVMQARQALEELGLFGKLPIIADGGIRSPSDMAKAIIAGASAVMLGRYLAGSKEAASQLVIIGGKPYKTYRGMGSLSAIQKRYAADRYGKPAKRISEGVEGLVEYTGSIVELIEKTIGTLQASLGYAGASNIKEAWRARLGKLSESAKKEVKPHDLVL